MSVQEGAGRTHLDADVGGVASASHFVHFGVDSGATDMCFVTVTLPGFEWDTIDLHC
jgi:hypothetical protein